MASLPYLQRRGGTYSFRIAVPPDLRPIVGTTEITRSLKTPDRRTAAPRALLLASQALNLFAELRAMPKKKRRAEYLSLDYITRLNISLPNGARAQIEIEAEPHEQAQAEAMLRAAIQEYRAAGAEIEQPSPANTPLPALSSTHPTVNQAPQLSAVIASFIAQFPESKSAMLTKHKIVLPIFLDIIGDKPISEIRQAEIKGFFATINRLPPYATRRANELGISLQELAELDHPEILSKSSFFDTHKACIRAFLKSCRDDLHDQGFPAGLHTDYSYNGKDSPRNAQRALTPDELKRLFEGPELQQFASQPGDAHKFWLPVVGLYTGARANEICQINPQTDVRTDEETGIPFILLSAETEAGEGIEKSIKTDRARKVPLHPHLIELGFPEYIDALKSTGAEQLFPAWTPRGGRAAPNAINWFSTFLKEIGLYGVENEDGYVLLGMHAFRHTLLTYGEKQKPPIDLSCISGHVVSPGGRNARDRYIDQTIVSDLRTKHDRLAGLNYGLSIPKPILPR
ncbi:DUF6538 domain-containing protein [Zoogloea sp.]|uniref:DUF6538 domain-containing protein n=1 Tax=Zoogloea sp. TaxID=49181 RepID=UPI0035B2AABF